MIPSKDGKAILLLVLVTTELSGLNFVPVIEGVRDAARDGLPDTLQLNTTGGPGFAADSANACEGADFRLLALSAAVVAVLLLLTYKSPILCIIPLLIVGVADRVATVLAGNMLEAAGYSFDASTAVVSVLVFGAGTNYALLLTSRYRDELRLDHDKHRALWKAWKGSLPAILASNLTVVAAILMLLLSTQPNIRNLGAGAPIGLLVALFATLTALPAAYYIAPRWVFWPFVPKPAEDSEEGEAEEAAAGSGSAVAASSQENAQEEQNKSKAPDNKWYSVAKWVSQRPAGVLAGGIAVLIVLSLGMIGANYGLSQTQQFTIETESVTGLEQLEDHYPAGFASGINVVVVFVVLGVLPLIVMAQVGIIVSLGVLLDTFLVHTLIVPALFDKVGNYMWWPSKLAKQHA